MTPSRLSCCGDHCGNEEAGSVTVNELIRTIAFQRLLQTRQPVSAKALINELGGSPVEVEAGLAELDRQGLIRRNQSGDVVGSVGLSIEPSRHELHGRDQQFWTWCAYDAVGILGALGASGRVLSKSPLTGAPIEVNSVMGRQRRAKSSSSCPTSFRCRTARRRRSLACRFLTTGVHRSTSSRIVRRARPGPSAVAPAARHFPLPKPPPAAPHIGRPRSRPHGEVTRLSGAPQASKRSRRSGSPPTSALVARL